MNKKLARLKDLRVFPGGVPYEKPFHQESGYSSNGDTDEPEETPPSENQEYPVQCAKINEVYGDGDEKVVGLLLDAERVEKFHP